MGTNKNTQNGVKGICGERHPENTANSQAWAEYKLAYRGGKPFAESAIAKHQKEKPKAFRDRKARAMTLNFCRPFARIRVSYLIKEDLKPEGPINADEYLQNFDKKGTDFTNCTKRIATESMVYGSSVVVVDMPETAQPLKNKKEQIDLGVRPYITIFPPGALINWGLGDDGEFDWAILKFGKPGKVLKREGSGFVLKETEKVPTYILWTRDEFVKFDEKGNMIGQPTPHPIKYVPIVVINYQSDEDNLFGRSFLTDIEPLNKRIIDLLSRLDEIVNKQTWSQLVFQGLPISTETEKVIDENGVTKQQKKAVELGTDVVLYYNENTNPPAFIAPDAAQGALVLQIVGEIVKALYRLAELQRGSVTEGGQPISGIAHGYEFINTNKSLADQGKNLAQGLEKILWLMHKWEKGKEARDKFKVPFPADFGIAVAKDIVTIWQMVMSPVSATIPEEIQYLFLRAIVKAEFPELPEKEFNKVLKALEDKLIGDQAPPPRTLPEETPQEGPEAKQKPDQGQSQGAA